MNIQMLHLRGATGIRKGMGIDEITLDLAGKDGLISLAGPTGIGKTTLLEACQPYPQLISRPNAALIRHFDLRDSVKQLKFLHNGDLWDTVVKIDPEAGRCEGYIYLNGSTESLTDGKITEYKRVITQEFGSIALFTNSVFTGQNSPKMSSMQPATLKELIAEFCGKRLQDLAEKEDFSKRCVATLLKRLEAIDSDIRHQSEIIGQHSEAATMLASAENDQNRVELRLRELRVKRNGESNEHARLKALSLQEESVQVKIMALNSDSGSLSVEIKAIVADKTFDTNALGESIDANQEEQDAENAILADKEAIEGAADRTEKLSVRLADLQREKVDIDTRLQTARETLNQKRQASLDADQLHGDHLNKARESYSEIEGRLTTAVADIDAANKSLADLRDDREIAELNRTLAGYRESAEDLERRGTVLKVEAFNVTSERIDCNSEDCPFIEKALAAKAQIPTIEAQILEKGSQNLDAIATLAKRVEALQAAKSKIEEQRDAAIATGNDLKATHTTAHARRSGEIEALRRSERIISSSADGTDANIDELKADIDQAKELAAKLPDIKVAESRLKDLISSRSTLDFSLGSTEKQYQARIDTKNAKLAEIETELTDLRAKLDPHIAEKISAAESKVRDLDFEIGTGEDVLKQKEADIVRLGENVKTGDAAAEEMKRLSGQRQKIATEHGDWAYMRIKCGKDGIQALEINSVVPGIKYHANKLLERAFGPSAMIDIRTLSSDNKEVLELRAIDADGDSVLIGDRSGGQQWYGMRPMRLALAGIAREKSGINYGSCFSDEEDDGLSEEAAIMFTQLYRAFLDEHGFKKAIFISHKEHCVALADHVVRLGPGGIQS